MPKRLLIADDHELMLAGISHLLGSEFEIVGVARDGRTLVEEAKRLSPEVIVLDLGMPEINGIEATRQIMDLLPDTRIVVLTQQLSPNHVRAAFNAGARGYVAKQAAATELLDALKSILQGHFYVTALAVQKDSQTGTRGALQQNPGPLFGDALTPRQREVLGLVAQGKSAKEIASELNISVKTVDFHKGILMDELGMRTTAELTRYALANGFVSE
jgi:DNA-binding NarL/FixJ family response regulator